MEGGERGKITAMFLCVPVEIACSSCTEQPVQRNREQGNDKKIIGLERSN